MKCAKAYFFPLLISLTICLPGCDDPYRQLLGQIQNQTYYMGGFQGESVSRESAFCESAFCESTFCESSLS